MRVGIASLMLVPVAGSAAAHGTELIPPDALWRSWSWEMLLPILIAAALYWRGVARLWTRAGRGRGIGPGHAGAFGLGIVLLLVALVSPLDPLGGTLLSAHMAQHALLVAVVPPLLLAGKPGAAFAWGLPTGGRAGLLGSSGWRGFAAFANGLSHPLPAGFLHGLALWLWHAPAAFEAALASYPLHALEHATFFGTAILFWRAILNARHGTRVGGALAAGVATLIHGGLLGALITLAVVPLYGWYVGHTELWGLSALEDQQLAGLIMWVPMGIVYLAACLVLAGRLVGLNGDGRQAQGYRTVPEQ